MLIALTMSIAMMATTIPAYADTAQQAQVEVHHNEGYDPAHPLAGMVDTWNLSLPTKYIGEYTIVNANVQAMLTGQMDQYYMPPVGYSTSAMGNQVYTSQEAYDRAITEEQALYEWFCNWLNGMDFENMSEMERAKEIQKVLGNGENVILSGEEIGNRNGYYSILIEKNGNCTEYAIVATSLAKALGLKSAMSGTGTHAVYYIQIDGKAYFGQNNVLNLNVPTPDFVAFD